MEKGRLFSLFSVQTPVAGQVQQHGTASVISAGLYFEGRQQAADIEVQDCFDGG